MSEMRSSRRTAALLVVLCIGLAFVVFLELNADQGLGKHPDRILPPTGFTLPPLAEIRFHVPSVGEFAAIGSRPLFSRSRRPWAAEPRSPAEPAPEKLAPLATYTLVGVLIAPRGRMALLTSADGFQVGRLFEGQETSGWTVEEILPDRVLLRQGQATKEIALRDDLAPKTIPQGSPQRSPGGRAPPAEAEMEQAQLAKVEPVSDELQRAIAAIEGR
jgi:hypothetical protein